MTEKTVCSPRHHVEIAVMGVLLILQVTLEMLKYREPVLLAELIRNFREK